MSFKIIQGTLAADVAPNGTFTVAYPTGTTAGHNAAGVNHQLVVGTSNVYSAPVQFTLAFGNPPSGVITVTNKTAGTWTAGSTFGLQAELAGLTQYIDGDTSLTPPNVSRVFMFTVPLGTPIAAVANNISTTQSIGVAGVATQLITKLDVPRTVQVAFTGTSNVTVAGTDVYGNAMSEVFTVSATGKKAFATVTSITSSAAITAFTAGVAGSLGLPVFLPAAGFIVSEIISGAKPATAGTFTAGTIAASVTATGSAIDVRGLYAPNTSITGTDSYTLICALPDPGYKGTAQA